MSLKTKKLPVDNCQLQIAKALLAGKAIWCYVTMNKEEEFKFQVKGWVISYLFGYDKPYVTEQNSWRYAVPCSIEMRVKKASEIVKWMEYHNYQPDINGNWTHPTEPIFTFKMFSYCGKPWGNVQTYAWHDDWLEEEEE